MEPSPSPEFQLATESYRHLARLLAARTIRQHRCQGADHPKKSDAKSSSAVTSAFRSSADFLPVPLEVARHLLLRNPAFVPARILLQASSPWEINGRPPATTAADIKESHTDIDTETYLPICQECGAAVQPADNSGTTVRLKSCSTSTPLSRSARRRASRRKATIMKKCNNPAIRQTHSNLSHYIEDPHRRIFACCLNYSQITCGCCGGVSRLAGQSNPKPYCGSRKQQNAVKGKRSMRELESSGRQNSKESVTKTEGKGEEDFLTLAPREEKPKRKKEPPKLGQPKRKKKTPGNLLNFLSSLND